MRRHDVFPGENVRSDVSFNSRGMNNLLDTASGKAGKLRTGVGRVGCGLAESKIGYQICLWEDCQPVAFPKCKGPREIPRVNLTAMDLVIDIGPILILCGRINSIAQ